MGVWVADGRGLENDTFEKSMTAIGCEVCVVDISWTKSEARIEHLLMSQHFDYLLHMPYGTCVDPKCIPYFSRRYRVPTILWGTDDDWLFFADVPHSTKILGPFHDWIVTNHEPCVHEYRKIGCHNVLLEKITYSRSVWEGDINSDRETDVYFCGRANFNRKKYVDVLRGMGVNFKFNWTDETPLPLEDMVNRYKQAKIAINFTISVRSGIYNNQMKGRIFEGMAGGCMVLSEYCPTIEKYFTIGEHLDVFRDEEEMVRKVKFYLENENERKRIAEAGFSAVKAYVEEDKFERIFKTIEDSGPLGL